jgi:hypothetical protein
MRSSSARWSYLTLMMLIVAGACDRPDVNWQPILERSASQAMRSEVERAALTVESAAEIVDSNPDEAAVLLRAADRSLRHLLDYYLPLLEAREYSYNALLFFNLGELDRVEGELDRAESRLIEIAQLGQGRLLREVEPPLEDLEDARAALRADAEATHELLQNLTIHLNNMVVKGGLIVD